MCLRFPKAFIAKIRNKSLSLQTKYKVVDCREEKQADTQYFNKNYNKKRVDCLKDILQTFPDYSLHINKIIRTFDSGHLC